MALVTSSRAPSTPSGKAPRARPSAIATPPEQRPAAAMAAPTDGTQRERVRMELLVARARAARG